ncbi:GMC oxidoreductase [Pelagibius sp. Alg239-R121]|uniref:GMC oxidoreductase n=1 Tax=Pelagibius sp. Alg239-R121 TaxID=2993448 RepID=UPI0024A668A7|nr:GMC family oxidoreductase [Pelagibius sp. Alg239-R121]
MSKDDSYDVVIVGSGFAGANLALLLGSDGKRVLIIEAGDNFPSNREDFMENFFLNTFKSPSSPYSPDDNGLDPARTNAPRPTIQALVEKDNGVPDWDNPEKAYFTYTDGSLPFTSTYERVAGGTGNHWMGTCLRMSNADLKLKTNYGHGLDWPLDYDDLQYYYAQAEYQIGVSADVAEQEIVGTEFAPGYSYPMRGIPKSNWDQIAKDKVDGAPLTDEDYTIDATIVTATPAGRNSEPYQERRVCHGNTNCTPVCPIQAKYDPTVSLDQALATGNVDIIYKSVVDYITVDSAGKIDGVHYITYEDILVPASSGATGQGTATGPMYVLAAHAVENAKILLNSARISGKNIANTSDQVGRNLMDHPVYLAWGLLPSASPAYAYRGPISTSGIETLRDGPFRSKRAAWRIELGNAAWNWPVGDPYVSGLDYIYGTNNGGTNSGSAIYGNQDYVTTLNDILTRQFRIGFLVEQDAEASNRVQLSTTETDNLKIPRPLVTYGLSEYTMKGFEKARVAADEFMSRIGATDFTVTASAKDNPATFTYNKQTYNYSGAGHLCGTHVMGTSSSNSVVTSTQRSWDHDNLYVIGCGSMPSIGTENPTLTMTALTWLTAQEIANRL